MPESIVSPYVLTGAQNQTINGNLTVTGTVSKPVTVSSYIVQGKLNGNQSIPSSIDTLIQFVDDFDANNWWNASTYQLQPTVAGYYLITVGVWFADPGSTSSQLNLQGRKNGNTFAIVQAPNNTSGTGQSLGFTKIVYFDGSTDYADFTVYQSTGVNRDLQYGTTDGAGTWFSAVLLTM
jgi:hypothetical protein